jgi:hypothetical protein
MRPPECDRRAVTPHVDAPTGASGRQEGCQCQLGCILIMDEVDGVSLPSRHLSLAQEEGVRTPAHAREQRGTAVPLVPPQRVPRAVGVRSYFLHTIISSFCLINKQLI